MAAVALWEEDSWGEEAKIAKELQGLALWAYACKWDFKAAGLIWVCLKMVVKNHRKMVV